jgi:hypothetical protein
MSMFEDRRYRWRETYFVLFQKSKRPTLKAAQKALSELSDRYSLSNLSADDSGRLESLTLLSPDDFAALDICYTSGEEVLEQRAALAKEMEAAAREAEEEVPVDKILTADARFDVLHFERIPEYGQEEDEADEMLDPSALLLVLGALARLTGGVAVDPQAGAILSEED